MTSRGIVALDEQVLLVLLLAAWSVTPARVHVDAGELEAPLVDELSAELPGAVATSTANADLFLNVERKNEELEVTIRDQLGRPVLTRTVSLADGVTPALRRIVLVVANAVENTSLAPPDVAPPPRPPPAVALALSAAFQLSWWMSDAAPQLGFSGSIALALPNDFDIGLRLIVSGDACCRRTAPTISGEAHERSLLVEGGWRILELGERSWLRAHAGLGLSNTELLALPDGFEGAKSEMLEIGLGPIAQLGAALNVELFADLLSLEAAAGFDLRPILRLSVSLPEPYDQTPLDPGPFNPWIRAGLTLNFL